MPEPCEKTLRLPTWRWPPANACSERKVTGITLSSSRYSVVVKPEKTVCSDRATSWLVTPARWARARPGGLGETCAVVIVVAGLYLVYRNYVKWQLPVAFLVSACAVVAVAPVFLAGPTDRMGNVTTVMMDSQALAQTSSNFGVLVSFILMFK